MNVYWLEQTQAEPPLSDAWLSAAESHFVSRLRFAKRYADWRLGRWAAKLAVSSFLDVPQDFQTLARIEVLPQPSGAPQACYDSIPLPVTISISHSAGTAICALAAPLDPMGCDLEVIEPRASNFVADYFTPEEQEIIAAADSTDRDMYVTLLWSAKESALKALGEGLRMDTRCMAVTPYVPPCRDTQTDGTSLLIDWQPLRIQSTTGQLYYGWWRRSGAFVQTVVTAFVCDPPIELHTDRRALTLVS